MPDNFSFRQANKLIRKLDVRSGNIVVVKSGTALANKAAIDVMQSAIERAEISNVLIVVVDNFSDLDVLDDKIMSKAGWVRLSSVSRRLIRT